MKCIKTTSVRNLCDEVSFAKPAWTIFWGLRFDFFKKILLKNKKIQFLMAQVAIS